MLGLDVNLLVVSPLSRAIQTATIAFGEKPPMRTVLSPLHSERVSADCDLGRPKSQLAADFPWIKAWEGFDELEDDWSPTFESDANWVRTRVPAFFAWLRQQPEQTIAVVGHGAYFNSLLGKHLRNCEVARLRPRATRNVPEAL